MVWRSQNFFFSGFAVTSQKQARFEGMSDALPSEEGGSGDTEEAGIYRRTAIQPKMPALDIVVGSDGLHEHAPRGRRPCAACDPVPTNVMH